MQLAIDQKDIDKFLMIGDKVLIKPKNPQSQTKTGLYLPPTVQQGEKIQAGYVIKAGPGYPLPAQNEEREVWEKKADEEVRYLPLQAREGDLAIYLQKLRLRDHLQRPTLLDRSPFRHPDARPRRGIV